MLRRGRVVASDLAIDVLWAARLPQDPLAALQTHMFRLRRGLPDGLIESVGDGYRLDPVAVVVDADRLGEIVTPASDHADELLQFVVLGRQHVHVRLEGSALDRKLTALRAMATQTGGLIAELDAATYAEQVCEEWFVDAPVCAAPGALACA